MRKTDLLFLMAIVLMGFLYGLHRIIPMRPYSIHQWRQTDCLSITLNYSRENLPFVQPEIHNVTFGEGKVVSEFPVIYYMVGKLWKITGQNESIFRILNLLIVITGIFLLYRLTAGITGNQYIGLLTGLLLFASPLLVYYGSNFLMNAPAFGLALAGGYFVWKYLSGNRLMHLVTAAGIFTLAGLLKISSLLLFCSLVAVFLAAMFGLFGLKKLSAQKWLPVVLAIMIVLGINFIWYKYAIHYNTIHKTRGIFLQGFYPIWDLDKAAIRANWHTLRHNLLPAYFHPYLIYFVLLAFILNLFHFKSCNRILILLNIATFFGVFAYILFFYKAFDVHDYYLTDLLLFVPVTLLTFSERIVRTRKQLASQWYFYLTAILFVLFLSYYTALKIRIRYNIHQHFRGLHRLLPKEEIDVYNWYHWHYATYYRAYESAEPWLRNLGIRRTDRIISIPDQSINITLYLMDQKGFTDFGRRRNPPQPIGEWIEHCRGLGARYLIINDKELLNDSTVVPYCRQKISEYNNLILFDLQNLPHISN